MTYVLQGIATEYGKCLFGENGNVLHLKDGCFDGSIASGSEVALLLNHDPENCIGTTTNGKLEVYAGAKGVAFRYSIPESWDADFADKADNLETYLAVSIGLKDGSAELVLVDGIEITSLVEAKLFEISLLDKPPAIHSTYGRIVSLDTCGTLKDDYDSGRLDLIGRYIGIHRAFKASENGGIVKYNHAPTDYERAADGFLQALRDIA
jgi:hypothetical protein